MWREYISVDMCLCLQQEDVCGEFSADYSDFQKNLLSCRSSVLKKKLYSFHLKLAPKLSLISTFWHKAVWELPSTQSTEPESLTHISSRTFWKLPILPVPVESVFCTFSCHIQKSNAFIMIIHCQQCALHYAVYNTAGRVFSRDKDCCSLANGRQ